MMARPFWVKVDSIPASPGSTTIYVYYGKSDATTTKNGDNTFLFFDDFETDLSKWSYEGTAPVLSTDYAYEGSKSVKHFTGTSRVYKWVSWSNVAVHVRYRDRMTGNLEATAMNTPGGSVTLMGVHESFYSNYYFYRIGTNWYQSSVARSAEWHEFVIRCRATLKQFLIDGNLQTNTVADNSIVEVGLGSAWGANTETGYYDAVFVRKYVDPEPSHGNWGSEESVEGVVQLDDAVYMHGKHSWHVTGISGKDFVTEQTLSSNVVEYIRNRKAGQKRGVTFSFWYKPDGVISGGWFSVFRFACRSL